MLEGNLFCICPFPFPMNWFVISTPRHQETSVKQTLEKYLRKITGYGGANSRNAEVFLPMRFKTFVQPESGVKEIRRVPIIQGLVFVRSEKERLDAWLKEAAMGCVYYVDVKNEPIVVPDYQIRLFRDYLDFIQDDVMLLRKPYTYFLEKKTIRIVNGPFAGLEGKLFQIKGNYKLVLGVGNTAFAISDIARYTRVVVDENDESTYPKYSFYEQKLAEEVASLPLDDADSASELFLKRIYHWQKAISVLLSSSPLASYYIAYGLLVMIADVYDKRRPLFEAMSNVLQDIVNFLVDYLGMAQEAFLAKGLVDKSNLQLDSLRGRQAYRAGFDHFGFPVDRVETAADDRIPHQYSFASQTDVLRFIITMEEWGEKISACLACGEVERAFCWIVQVFRIISCQLNKKSFHRYLNASMIARLQGLLKALALLYRNMREGQDEDFVKSSQAELRKLLKRSAYQEKGFFNLLGAIRGG